MTNEVIKDNKCHDVTNEEDDLTSLLEEDGSNSAFFNVKLVLKREISENKEEHEQQYSKNVIKVLKDILEVNEDKIKRSTLKLVLNQADVGWVNSRLSSSEIKTKLSLTLNQSYINLFRIYLELEFVDPLNHSKDFEIVLRLLDKLSK